VAAHAKKQERERQAALTQALRREANERRADNGEDAEFVQSVCECSDPACEELVWLTIDEYGFIRRVPIRLVVRPGHVHDESERVLGEDRDASSSSRSSDPPGKWLRVSTPAARSAGDPAARSSRLQPGSRWH